VLLAACQHCEHTTAVSTIGFSLSSSDSDYSHLSMNDGFWENKFILLTQNRAKIMHGIMEIYFVT